MAERPHQWIEKWLEAAQGSCSCNGCCNVIVVVVCCSGICSANNCSVVVVVVFVACSFVLWL